MLIIRGTTKAGYWVYLTEQNDFSTDIEKSQLFRSGYEAYRSFGEVIRSYLQIHNMSARRTDHVIENLEMCTASLGVGPGIHTHRVDPI